MPARISEETEIYLASLYDQGKSIKKICQQEARSQRVVVRSIHKFSKMRRSTVGLNDTNKFEQLDNESSYWLGFIAADGHVRYQPEKHRYELVIEVNVKDEEHIDKFMRYLGFGSKFYRNRDNCVGYSFSSKRLVTTLLKWVTPNNKTYVNNFYLVPGEYRKSFVRGYFDGDGNAKKHSMGITSCLETLKPLADYISEVVEGPYRLYDKPGQKASSARWNKKETLNFRRKFNGLPRLERKWNENLMAR